MSPLAPAAPGTAAGCTAPGGTSSPVDVTFGCKGSAPLKTILIVWEHGGHLGHLGKLLPVARVLREAGHRVVFGVADLATAGPYLRAAGYASIDVPAMPPPTEKSFDGDPIGHAEVLLCSGFSGAQQVLASVGAWHRLFAQVKPDAVLADASPMALYAARCMGLRTMAIGHGFDIPPHHAKPCFAPWTEGAVQRMATSALQLQDVFDQLAVVLCGQWGKQVPLSMGELFHPAHCLVCTWPELDYFDRPELMQGQAWQYLGPVWGDLPNVRAQSWPEASAGAKRRKVLCYFYLHEKRFDLLWQALVQEGADVLVIAPGASEEVCEAARAFKVQVINYPVELGTLLSQCDAVICHGGMGLVSMALHAGKPLLILPEYMEHAVLAYRLCRQDLALATVQLRDMTRVKDKVLRLLGDAALVRRAGTLAAKYASHHPAVAAQHVARRLTEMQSKDGVSIGEGGNNSIVLKDACNIANVAARSGCET